MRFFKFTNPDEITEKQSIIKAYIYEAIEIEKAGLKVIFKSHEKLEPVEELQIAFDKNRFQCLNTRPTTRVQPLFFGGQTIQNPRNPN